jgi:hypothetical protein
MHAQVKVTHAWAQTARAIDKNPSLNDQDSMLLLQNLTLAKQRLQFDDVYCFLALLRPQLRDLAHDAQLNL